MHSVALVDDHPVFREVVGLLLSRHDDLRVVAHAGSAPEAVRVIEDSSPNVVVLDLGLQGEGDGLDVARWARRLNRPSKFLVLSVHEDPRHVARAVEAGVAGYAFKSQSGDDLATAIRTVAAGQRYFAPNISLPAVDEVLRGASALARLTQREREIFEHTVRGRSTKETAQLLAISHRTVETHRSHVMTKLDVKNVLELTRLASKLGVLPV